MTTERTFSENGLQTSGAMRVHLNTQFRKLLSSGDADRRGSSESMRIVQRNLSPTLRKLID